jgi:dCMP deaminase
MERDTVDQYFLQICAATARRSTCLKAHVGAVLVSPRGEIRSTGYNGAPRGFAHCLDVGCLLDAHGKCMRSVHAEINALLQAKETAGSTAYCTHTPCWDCLQALINAGITRVVYTIPYLDPRVKIVGLDTVDAYLDAFTISGLTFEHIKE